MIYDILIPMISVSLAEIGDKTQLTLLCLAAKTKRHVVLFAGAMLAFLIVDGIAVIAGGFLAGLVPDYLIKIISGILFMGFGLSFILQKTDENVTCSLKQPFMSAFTMILITEMGDKTQITSAVFASNYNSFLVLIGIMLGLGTISLITVQIGSRLLNKLNVNLLHRISGGIFILLGISAFLTLFFQK